MLCVTAPNTVYQRRISCLSNGSHKFTVINYGKVEEEARIRDLGNDDYPVNTPPLTPSGIIPMAGSNNFRKNSNFNRRFSRASRHPTNDFQLYPISSGDSDDSKVEVPPPDYPANDDSVYLKVGQGRRFALSDVAKRGRIFAKRNRFRIFHRSGECNMTSVKVDKQGARYLSDLFTTLLEMKWRYNIIVYLVSFVLSWVLFALVWWAVHATHGYDEGGTPCVIGVQDFKSALLFSIETQHTIGYGSRSITDRCGMAYILLMLQSVFGAVTQCVVTGVIFARLARPNKRGRTILFSKKAVICNTCDHLDPELGARAPRAGPTSLEAPLSLEFRVGDMRNSQLIGVQLNAILIEKTMSDDERRVDLRQERLKISTESGDDYYFLAWPIKICHRIDKESPLWNMSPEKLLETEWEILVILEANCEATGGTIQVRASYLLSEIMWGHCLAPLVTYQKGHGQCKVDYSQFNEVIPIDTPELSSKEIYERRHTTPIPTSTFGDRTYPEIQFIDETLLKC